MDEQSLPQIQSNSVELDEKIKEWLLWDRNEKTREEVLRLVNERNFELLHARMLNPIAFGTAGLRAEMCAGFSRLNDLVIIQVAQGQLRYLQSTTPDLAHAGIVIGFDARHNSRRFASLVANVFLREQVKVYLFSEIVPTPLVAFAVLHLGCASGIMVTASHNPKKDNGYKVYSSNGAQILSPHDSGIMTAMQQNRTPLPTSWDLSPVDYESNDLCSDPLADVWNAYVKVSVQKFCNNRQGNAETPLKFTYSAFHGVGALYFPRLFEQFGFQSTSCVLQAEQAVPDPDFTTVPCPNPEEGRAVLELSIQTAEANGSGILLVSDPDADRFQLAERVDGAWYIFTGNEIGALLAHWLWQNWQKRNPGKSGADVYVINSTVSSKFVATMAKAEGFRYDETLTGFKWMGNKAQQLRQQGKEVLLAFEESIGYMCGESLDKDGVIAAVMFAELAAVLYARGDTLRGQLDTLYKQYGYHMSFGSYFISTDQAVTKRIFDRLRTFGGREATYPDKCGRYCIEDVRDLTTGYDSSQQDKRAILPVSSSSQMITFTLADGQGQFTVRASGTEPKLKYYIEVISPPGSDASAAAMQLEEIKQAVVKDFIQPSMHELQPAGAFH